MGLLDNKAPRGPIIDYLQIYRGYDQRGHTASLNICNLSIRHHPQFICLLGRSTIQGTAIRGAAQYV